MEAQRGQKRKEEEEKKGVHINTVWLADCIRSADKDLSSWGGPDMSKSRLFIKFRTFRISNRLFDKIAK